MSERPPTPRRFFIVGCQRSGTTLMRLILDSHPNVFCYDDATAYDVLRRKDYAVPTDKTLQAVGYKILRWTERLCQPTIPAEPGEAAADQFYTGEPLIFMLRDVRDVIASMLKLKWGASTWLETWGRPVLMEKVAHEPLFRERYADELLLVHRFGHSLAAMGALYWKCKTLAYLDYRALGFPLLAIRYEHLARSPREECQRIVSFLELPWAEQLLRHHQLQHPETDENGLATGRTDSRRPVDADSIGQWSTLLTPEQVTQIKAIAGTLNHSLYDPHFG